MNQDSNLIARFTVVVSIAITVLILFLTAAQVVQIHNTRWVCQQNEHTKNALLVQFKRSVASIEDPKTRPIYYKEHPELVKPTLKIYGQLIRDFRPADCSGFFGPK